MHPENLPVTAPQRPDARARTPRRARWWCAAVAVAVVAAGCGDGEDESATPTPTATAVESSDADAQDAATPVECSADGNGTACDDEASADGDRDVAALPAGLLCRDLVADGFGYDEALDYWAQEGSPDRMDGDLDGVPCETIYPEADAEGRRVEQEALARAEAVLASALAACNEYSSVTNGAEPFDGSADDPTVDGGFGSQVGPMRQRWVDADGVELVIDVDAGIVTGPDGPDGVMPRPYSFACPPEVFVGTLDEGGPEALDLLEPDPGGAPVMREGAIVRGDAPHAYLVDVPSAGAGEQLVVTVTSLEDNAVVRVVAPDGTTVVEEVSTTELELTAAGEYLVEVGATRGNATYELEVGISVPAG